MSTPAAALASKTMSDGSSFLGRQLGPYLIQARLGAGGMGEVYRARDNRLGRDVSNDSGQFQIFVRPFPNVEGGHWQISSRGGTMPVWARGGQELFYLDSTNALTAVSVHTTPTFGFEGPTKLFDGPYYFGAAGRTYDVSPDGQRFLLIKNTMSGDQTSTLPSIVVVVNWVEELKQKVPTQ